MSSSLEMTTNDHANSHGSTVPLLIDGKDVHTAQKMAVVSSEQKRTVWKAAAASNADALAALEAASRAFPAWSATKPAARRDILIRAADVFDRRAEELKGYMKEETSAHAAFSEFNIATSSGILRDVAGRVSTALCGSYPVCDEPGTQAVVVKEPYGVVLGIAPWNAPYILGIRSVVYALAAGNTCILKGSEFAPRCFWAIGSVFREAGLPAGCLNVIFHRPEDAASITAQLIEHDAVKKINFTGSTAVGRIIAQTAGRNLKPTLMELGGKNSAIVCEDADLDRAAQQCALGTFLHAGQVCMSTERILVHKSVLKLFTGKFKKAIETIFDSGLVQDALSKGAEHVHGTIPSPEAGALVITPTVLGGVTKEMDVYYTESFGPCVSLIAVDSDEEAVAIANDSDYGLSGAVFTKDLSKGLSMAGRIESGAVHINSMTIHDEAGLPHGGVKSSGWGRFNAQAGLVEFLRSKTITFQI
ncbi:salicylaldehyde dehydrogenase [Grosmannia clavigera kw1407]|uniref:Salicylaldehyde dehydrogenase n=1 Tax=Grosmannia clavigera (strain kw1407 / UAMH 11150) TaxID=655863 RepID=F0XEC4_GROCL|nr:salicylaldehyde dehydrogenase [Grosmannia clavigera kw1407]EFX04006.1 salicylaldehyde dehydrogenase [Grosmannia clavigera kw1407]